MKKLAYVLCLFALTTGIAVWLINVPSPTIRTIFSETHKQITNLKNINVKTRLTGRQNRAPPLVDLNPVSSYLELLGFSDKAKLYPDSGVVHPGIILPVIVTTVTSHDYESAIQLISSVRLHLSNHTVIIYDVGLGSYELLKVRFIS
jgi:hypothetical protein